MKHSILTAAAFALAAGPALAAGHAAGPTGYALANDGGTLVIMADIAAPEAAATVDLTARLRAIAYRPVTGALLGVGDGAIYEIDPATGGLTDLGADFAVKAAIAPGAMVAFDFNNRIDAARAVSTGGDNLVYFPDGFGVNDERAGSVRRVTDLAYAEADPNAGAMPMVFANAYTNAIAGKTADSTFQYGIDAGTDALVSIANNAGTLETVGRITVDGAPVDLTASGGFDILSPAEGENLGYAVLQIEGAATAGLYEVDLNSGAATMLADLAMGGFGGFAVSMPQ